MISAIVRQKLKQEHESVQSLLRELRQAAEAGDMPVLVQRTDALEQSLSAHLSLVGYVLDALADDDQS